MVSRVGTKASTLRYFNPNWITIQTTEIRPFSSVNVRRKKVKKINFLPKQEEEKIFPFLNSRVSFSREETSFFVTSQSTNNPNKLTRNPSRLMQLHDKAIELENKRSQVFKQRMQDQHDASKERALELEREDSYISVNFDNDEDRLKDKTFEQIDSLESDAQTFSMPAVTKKDIMNSILEYADGRIEKDPLNKVRQVEGKFVEEGGRVAANLQSTSGMRKLKKIIIDGADETDNINAYSLENIATPQQRQEEAILKKKIAASHSGKKILNFLYANKVNPPSFLTSTPFKRHNSNGKPASIFKSTRLLPPSPRKNGGQ